MNAQPAPAWHGRTDSEETGPSQRWHHVVRPYTDTSRQGVALIGFAVDEGVQRNGGRGGAAAGPAALRAALANVPVQGEPALWDAGDVGCDSGDLETAQRQLGERVHAAMAQGCLPIVLGGGHEVAWGTFQGIAAARADTRRLLIVNLDAHFDLRMAARGNSGTPFRQIHDWQTAHGRPFHYRVLGISTFANTAALFERAEAMGVRYWLDEQLQDPAGLAQARQALAQDLAQADAVYLTVCLDLLPGGQAPGVSAPAALGVPLAHVEQLLDLVMASGLVVAADIAELNPAQDRDGLTARVAARLVARIARASARQPREITGND